MTDIRKVLERLARIADEFGPTRTACRDDIRAVLADNARLQARVAELDAQQPVAEIAWSDDGYKIGLLGPLRAHRLAIGTKLYAAPALPIPAIDLEQFRRLSETWLAQAERVRSMAGGKAVGIRAAAKELRDLLALIDGYERENAR